MKENQFWLYVMQGLGYHPFYITSVFALPSAPLVDLLRTRTERSALTLISFNYSSPFEYSPLQHPSFLVVDSRICLVL